MARRTPPVPGLSTTLLAFLLVTSTAGAALATAESGSVDRPPGTTTAVELELEEADQGVAEAELSWQVTYSARSAAEAARAENGSLQADWFEGPERVEAAMSAHPGSRVVDGDTAVDHFEADADKATSAPHGLVAVEYRATWRGMFADGRSRVVVGPAFADQLSPGDRFSVLVYGSIPAVAASTERATVHEVIDRYRWTVEEGPTPRVVFAREAFDSEGSVPEVWATFAVVVLAVVVAVVYRLS